MQSIAVSNGANRNAARLKVTELGNARRERDAIERIQLFRQFFHRRINSVAGGQQREGKSILCSRFFFQWMKELNAEGIGFQFWVKNFRITDGIGQGNPVIRNRHNVILSEMM